MTCGGNTHVIIDLIMLIRLDKGNGLKAYEHEQAGHLLDGAEGHPAHHRHQGSAKATQDIPHSLSPKALK